MMGKLMKNFLPTPSNGKHKGGSNRVESQPPSYLSQQPQESNYINHQQHSTCGFQNTGQPMQLQPNLAYQHHIYQPHQLTHQHQPIQTTAMSPTCQCHSNVMQMQPQQQSIPNYQIHTYNQQMRNDTIDSSVRMMAPEPSLVNMAHPTGITHQNLRMNYEQVSFTGYQANNNQMPSTNGQHLLQSAQYCDNSSYYSNQPPYMTSPQHPLNSQSSQPIQQPRNEFGMTHLQQDELAHRLQQQHISNFDEVRQRQQQHQQQQQHLSQPQQQMQQIDVDKNKNGWQASCQQQQQYQNHDDLADGISNDFSLEVVCRLYELERDELLKAAEVLKEDIIKLGDELSTIRKMTPQSSVKAVRL